MLNPAHTAQRPVQRYPEAISRQPPQPCRLVSANSPVSEIFNLVPKSELAFLSCRVIILPIIQLPPLSPSSLPDLASSTSSSQK